MSTTIMMPQQIDNAIKEMCGDAMAQVVAALADKYKFDVDEASRFLEIDALKIVRKRGPSSPKKDDKSVTKKTPSDKPKVKRGKTGYLLYADEVRAETKAELIALLKDDEKLKPQNVVCAIADKWKALEQSVRDEWNLKSKTPVTSDDEHEPVSDPEHEPVSVSDPEVENGETTTKKATKKATKKDTKKATKKETKKETENIEMESIDFGSDDE